MSELSDKALNYVRNLAPHIKEREAAKIIQDCAEALNAKDDYIQQMIYKAAQKHKPAYDEQQIKLMELEKELQKYKDKLKSAETWSSNWGLRRHFKGTIVITNKDGSFILIKEGGEDDDTPIAETLFYRMMDEVLTGAKLEGEGECSHAWINAD